MANSIITPIFINLNDSSGEPKSFHAYLLDSSGNRRAVQAGEAENFSPRIELLIKELLNSSNQTVKIALTSPSQAIKLYNRGLSVRPTPSSAYQVITLTEALSRTILSTYNNFETPYSRQISDQTNSDMRALAPSSYRETEQVNPLIQVDARGLAAVSPSTSSRYTVIAAEENGFREVDSGDLEDPETYLEFELI